MNRGIRRCGMLFRYEEASEGQALHTTTPPQQTCWHATEGHKKAPKLRATHARTHIWATWCAPSRTQAKSSGRIEDTSTISEHFAHITHPSRASSSPTSRTTAMTTAQAVSHTGTCYNCYRTHTCGTRARSPTSVVTTLRLKILFIAHRIYGTTFEFPHPHPRRHRSWHPSTPGQRAVLHQGAPSSLHVPSFN